MNQNLILYLKGVDWTKVHEDYTKGVYDNMVKSQKKITIRNGKNLSTIPDTENGDTFTLKSNCVGSKLYFTTNVDAYNNFVQTGTPVYGGRCHYCCREFTTLRLGIPLKVKSVDGYYVVLYEGCNDTFECALAELYLRNPAFWRTQNYKYDEAENNLHFLFSLVHPDKKLSPAPDYKILAQFGGSANWEQFTTHFFTEVPDFIFVPIKSTYLSKVKKEV